MTSQESIDYFREREAAELAAAARAADQEARRLHLELAELYAAGIREAERTAKAKHS